MEKIQSVAAKLVDLKQGPNGLVPKALQRLRALG